MDIKHVLVPTDFSLPSGHAVNHGVEVARRFRARLTLLHVLEPEGERWTPEAERGADAARRLGDLLSPEDQDDLDLHVAVRNGNARKEIAAAVEELRPDVVVLGTHGRKRLGRLIIGSTTESLLRKLHVPVLTVNHVTRPMAFKRILFATDCSDCSLQGFGIAAGLARRLQAELVAVHAVHLVTAPSVEHEILPETRATLLENARRELAMLTTEGKRHGVKVRAMLAEGRPATQILKAAEESGADLILLPLESKGAVERALMGTTAEQIVREATIPVLSIPVSVAAPAC
jgi:nucleotide-binding universal stress UspA family protein